MAANVSSWEERERRILMVGEYFLANNGMSTRQAAKYFSANFFSISNATIHDYLQKYKIMVEKDAEKIQNMMDNNKPETISDEKIKKRVLNATRKFMEENKTIEQVAQELNESFWTVYRDLTDRLQYLDVTLYMQISEEMEKRSLENLTKKTK